MAHYTSGAIRGSVSCSRTLRQGIDRESMLTDVFLGASEVVGEGAAAHLVGAEETEVPGHLSGDGGGQTPEETLRALQSPDGPHH